MLNQLVKQLSNCFILSDESIRQFRRQNLYAGLKALQCLSGDLSLLMEYMLKEAACLHEWGYDIDTDYFAAMLSGIFEAQQNRDYVLAADLLELQLIPMLLQLQEVLAANYTSVTDEGILIKNLQGFTAKDAALAKQIEEYAPQGYCMIESTSSGLLTMRMTDETGTYYFHSNGNPVAEGRAFAEQYYSLDSGRYVIFGMGLGYHIKEMIHLDDGISIDIIETDMEVIRTAFSVMDMSWLTDNPRIRLLYDNNFLKLKDSISQDIPLLIHYPSLRHVENPQIKLQLEKFFIRDSGMRDFRIQFENNFRDNIVNCEEYVDALEPEFCGKNAVIVAAGPSLDKNMEQLRKKPENTVVVAVGTVFRKMVDMGILPDYVIFLDAQPHLYDQIKGLENQKIPIICASTACKRIAEKYSGKKYLICQNGYDRAESYAKEKGFRLYETGGSVSTIALDMCLQMGCKSVAYIGLDLAFTGNRSHAAATLDYAAWDGKDGVLVKAAEGGMLPASRLFVIYREWIERRAAKEDNRAEVIDATEGGALKKGLKKLTLKDTFALWEQEEGKG